MPPSVGRRHGRWQDAQVRKCTCGADPTGPNEVGKCKGRSEVDRTPLNALNTSEVVGGRPMTMGNDGGRY